MIDHNWQKFNRLVTGPSGSGKTTLAVSMLAELQPQRLVALDSKGDLYGKLRETFGATARLVWHPSELMASVNQGTRVTVLQLSEQWPSRLAAFRWFFAALYRAAETLPGRTVAFCDELQDFAPQGPQAVVPKEFMECLEKARCRQLDLLCACQAANRVNTAIRSQLTELVTFRQSEAEALKFTRGFEIPDRDVKALGKHQWIMRNGETGLVTLGGPKKTERAAARVEDRRGKATA